MDRFKGRFGLFLAFVLVTAAAAATSVQPAPAQSQETVVVGGQTTVRLDAPIGRISIGDDKVADFRVLEEVRGELSR